MSVPSRVDLNSDVGESFGRWQLGDDVLYQLGALAAMAAACGLAVRYVKPQGAPYNAVVTHERQAQAAVPEVLGSRSHDVMSGLGPAPLSPGMELPVGPPPTAQPAVNHLATPPPAAEVVLRAVRGPRDAWVHEVDALVETPWTASDRSNRVGIRLSGARLRHVDPGRQLPSEGVWRGGVQVPPGGEPVLFLADHPVTGGYPVVAVVVDADVDRAAQVRPGQRLRFT